MIGRVARPRALLTTLFDAAIAALDPAMLVARTLRVDRDALVVADRGTRATPFRIPLARGVLVVGAGKGAAALASAVESLLREHVRGGVVIVPRGYEAPLRRITIAHGGHPLPTAASVAATARLLACVDATQGVPTVVVLTGGASALLAQPARGLTLADKQRTTRLLLRSGANIAAINAVRKHLSRVKGGRLAERLADRRVVALVVSDVPGDDLGVIGSGPLTRDPTTFADAYEVLAAHGLLARVPRAVVRHLARGMRGRILDTPKRSFAASRVRAMLVATNATARRGAIVAARLHGVGRIVEQQRPLTGTTDHAADVLARRIAAMQTSLSRGASALLVAGGETTVDVGGMSGRGGRNQELALAVAMRLARRRGWTILCAGTDGIDGPTPAAGAFADGQSWRRAARTHGSIPDALRRHDVYPLLRRMGDSFSPGPTGTNVADLVLALVWRPQ